MKYNININQKVLQGQKLDIKDAAILDYLIVYCNSKNEKIQEQRYGDWTWISYKSLMKDMPLLEINSRQSLTPRITKLVNAGYIEKLNRAVGGKKRLFVKLTQKIDLLFVQTDSTVRENYETVRETLLNNNTTNNNTKDNIYPFKYKLPDSISPPDVKTPSYSHRLFGFYSIAWKEKYGFNPNEPAWGRFGKDIAKLHKTLSEHQIASMILTYLEWQGATESDMYVKRILDNACHPIKMMFTYSDAILANIRNVQKLPFTDEDKMNKIITNYLKKHGVPQTLEEQQSTQES